MAIETFCEKFDPTTQVMHFNRRRHHFRDLDFLNGIVEYATLAMCCFGHTCIDSCNLSEHFLLLPISKTEMFTYRQK